MRLPIVGWRAKTVPLPLPRLTIVLLQAPAQGSIPAAHARLNRSHSPARPQCPWWRPTGLRRDVELRRLSRKWSGVQVKQGTSNVASSPAMGASKLGAPSSLSASSPGCRWSRIEQLIAPVDGGGQHHSRRAGPNRLGLGRARGGAAASSAQTKPSVPFRDPPLL